MLNIKTKQNKNNTKTDNSVYEKYFDVFNDIFGIEIFNAFNSSIYPSLACYQLLTQN